MPSALPTEDTQCKAVDTFGIGTYDSQRDGNGEHGENSEKREPEGRSLPDDATRSPQTNSPEEWLSYPNDPDSRTVTNIVSSENQQEDQDEDLEGSVYDPFEHDRNLAYPDSADARLGTLWYRGFIAHSGVPGDIDGNFQHFHPNFETFDARVETMAQHSILPQEKGVDGQDPGAMAPKRKKIPGKVSEEHSELPLDSDNPSARTDYYDHMMPGHAGSSKKAGFADYVAPSEDSGAYAQKKESESALPSPMKNEETMDDFLQSLGNFWSGKEIEDISSPQGFPTEDFSENSDFDRSDNQDGGTIVPLGDDKMFASTGNKMQNRRATNIPQVVALTKDFLKKAGKKDLTKRHVLAFLQSQNLPQYLSSDIIRCLKISHDIHVKDVLDEFPVYREAAIQHKADSDKCDTCGSPMEGGYCTDYRCPDNKYTIPAKKASQQTTIARAWSKLSDLECQYMIQPEVANVFRRCAANLAHVLADMDKMSK